MDKAELKEFLEKNKSKKYTYLLRTYYPETYNKIDSVYTCKRFLEKIYRFCHDGEEIHDTCCICGKKTKFQYYADGYKKTCSGKCYDIFNKQTSKKRLKKAEKTMLRKYGVKNAAQHRNFKYKVRLAYVNKTDEEKTNIIEKVKRTKLKKYGDSTYNNVNKGLKTKLKKYGDPTYNNTDKRVNTCLKRYKTTTPLLCKGVADKAKKINLLRGYNFYTNHKDIIDNFECLFTINDYTGGQKNKLYTFKCKTCGEIVKHSLYKGRFPRCFKCKPQNCGFSLVEKELVDYIKEIYSGEIIENNKSIISPYEIDIYLPTENLAFEFNGIYWHSEFENKDEHYHINKTNACETKNIQLIHVYEHEWLNKKQIVKRKIKQLLTKNIPNEKFNCIVEPINDINIINVFLNENHLLGTCKCSLYLGAYIDNVLYAIMSYNTKDNINYELLRFCTNTCSVSTDVLAEHIHNYFIKEYNPKTINVFLDRRYYTIHDALYTKLGFTLNKIIKPTYYVFSNSNKYKLYSKALFSKNKLKNKFNSYDPTLSDWENLQLNNYNRIWDVGKLKYTWSL